MKEHTKELLIIPVNKDNGYITAKILYRNYEIGICEFKVGSAYPPQNDELVGAPYYTKYNYTLIFYNKDVLESLNVALDSIYTSGLFESFTGAAPQTLSNLNVPIGTYKNIGVSPEGFRYRLDLTTNETLSKIILNRIC